MRTQKQRLPAMMLLVTMLFGLVPEMAQAQVTPTYNPYQGIGAVSGGFQGDPRYQQGYGQRNNPAYYQPGGTGYSGGYGFTRLVPQLVGGVLGAAIGMKFGFVGALVGGALGFFGGKAISEAMYGDSYYGDSNYYHAASNKTNFIPGAVGAMLGAFMGSSFGVVGMVLGGGIGYLVGQGVSKVLFPNVYYGGPYNSPYAGGQYGSPYASAEVGAAAPTSPQSSAPSGDLAALKETLYESMKAYKGAMEDGGEELVKARRQDFLAAQQAYLDAKRALSP